MLVLHGISLSSYYNKVKLVLLEKSVPFKEEIAKTGKDVTDEHLQASPLGKIPYITTPEGSLCESQVIINYIETLYPTPALLPSDPWAAAKQRELIAFIELYLEMVVRDLYGAAFSGDTVSDSDKERIFKALTRNIEAFKRLANFALYLGGEQFTQADCAAFVHLPVVATTTKIVYGHDMIEDAGIDWKAYFQRVSERPSAKRVNADREASEHALLNL